MARQLVGYIHGYMAMAYNDWEAMYQVSTLSNIISWLFIESSLSSDFSGNTDNFPGFSSLLCISFFFLFKFCTFRGRRVGNSYFCFVVSIVRISEFFLLCVLKTHLLFFEEITMFHYSNPCSNFSVLHSVTLILSSPFLAHRWSSFLGTPRWSSFLGTPLKLHC